MLRLIVQERHVCLIYDLLCFLAVLWTGEVWEFVSFADRYPKVIYNILLFGFTSALGQVRCKITHTPAPCISLSYYFVYCFSNSTFLPIYFQTFIFMTVVYFGPLTCSIVTTTRKFFTILGSVLLFGNIITPLQWLGTILVFLGEFLTFTLPFLLPPSTAL